MHELLDRGARRARAARVAFSLVAVHAAGCTARVGASSPDGATDGAPTPGADAATPFPDATTPTADAATPPAECTGGPTSPCGCAEGRTGAAVCERPESYGACSCAEMPMAPRETPPAPPAAGRRTFCSLGAPVPGAVVPAGFCVRQYARVAAARTLSFAPDGALFVGAPTVTTPGGSSNGLGLVVLSDPDGDGAADVSVFARDVPDVHGVAVAPGAVYFTTSSALWRTPYAPGQRAETPGARARVADLPGSVRFTHGLGRTAGGVVFVSSAAGVAADPPGQIARVTPAGLAEVGRGFRNPMYVRCHAVDEVCLVSETGLDMQGADGAIDQLLLVRPGVTAGYPLCVQRDRVAPSLPPGTGGVSPDCSGVSRPQSVFEVDTTPFGLDWERGAWPAPYRAGLFVALHGSFYTDPPWQGAGVVFAPTDPRTHVPAGAFVPFVRGFGPGGSPLDRPADVAFAPDGRMFFADDLGGAVYWVAPESLTIPGS